MSRHPRFLGIYEPDVERRRESHVSGSVVCIGFLLAALVAWLEQFGAFHVLMGVVGVVVAIAITLYMRKICRDMWRERRVWPHRFSWREFLIAYITSVIMPVALIIELLKRLNVI